MRLRSKKSEGTIALMRILIGLIGVLMPACLWAADGPAYRAARSVHLGYPAPEGDLFFTEMVIEESVNGSYFMACGWNTGYFGLQQLWKPEDKVVIFSVWDPTQGDDPGVVKAEDRVEVLHEGEGVRIKRFGGEGTGGQCMAPFSWKLGGTNQFLLSAEAQDQKTAYTAWIFRPETQAWWKLATFRTQTGGQKLKGYYSFVEDFRRDGKSALEARRARYGRGWVRDGAGGWTPLAKARFTASGASWEAKETIDAGLIDGWFYLATGGATRPSRALRSMIESTNAPIAPPDWLRDFFAPAPRNNPAQTRLAP